MRQPSATMENSSLPSDVLNVTSSLEDAIKPNMFYVRYLAFTVIYIIIGTVGVLGNLFVIVIFIFFIKIADKVLTTRIYLPGPLIIKRKLPVWNGIDIEESVNSIRAAK